MVNIVRPRLNDYHGILMLQDKVDFAIPLSKVSTIWATW